MTRDYKQSIKIFKAIGEVNRAKIVEMLSTGEKCACVLLKDFNFTQPTLSHHMKVLMECGIVNCRKEGTWIYYSLDKQVCSEFIEFLHKILKSNENFECNQNEE